MKSANTDALTVSELLLNAKAQIAAQEDLTFSSPDLEARILFEHVSGHGRSWQIAHGQDMLDTDIKAAFENALAQRLAGEPIAFITGTQDFWSMTLAVDSSTLIPRQDTESLVELALSLPLCENAEVLDLGTGTGAIALALAKERVNWQITGVDRIERAVALAKSNALRNGLAVNFKQSNWFSVLDAQQFDLIVSNPPYVEQNSDYLQQGDLRFEPHSALTSGEDGLDDIRLIVDQAYAHLHNDAYLVIEHGASQAPAIAQLLQAKGYIEIESIKDYNDLARVIVAKKPGA
jgi:release factor glutamine methyltransferase